MAKIELKFNDREFSSATVLAYIYGLVITRKDKR